MCQHNQNRKSSLCGTVMAKTTKPRRSAACPPTEDEHFRPTREIRKSNAAKQATAEARRQRRREAYALNAVKIREKNRIHIAERRAAAKLKKMNGIHKAANKKSPSDLAAAELAASQTLAQMQAVRAAQEDSLTMLSPAYRRNEEQAVDREISELCEVGERQDEVADSSDEGEDSSDDDEEAAEAAMREMLEKSRSLRAIRQRRIRRLRILQSLGPRSSSRNSPSPDPPSSSPHERLPSLYDKLCGLDVFTQKGGNDNRINSTTTTTSMLQQTQLRGRGGGGDVDGAGGGVLSPLLDAHVGARQNGSIGGGGGTHKIVVGDGRVELVAVEAEGLLASLLLLAVSIGHAHEPGFAAANHDVPELAHVVGDGGLPMGGGVGNAANPGDAGGELGLKGTGKLGCEISETGGVVGQAAGVVGTARCLIGDDGEAGNERDHCLQI
ncbi:hypothetical protein R3P38DRAFT_2791168 [Favolaschia claudopus]|uniref:Uncharacterized protein n=1 Tax=Favolaschia claudopus TaxID=2862362 RepID=A0AAW0AI11_9AGAR